MSYEGGPRPDGAEWDVVGRELREVAGYARSWHLPLAALGVAAINAWYNHESHLAALPHVLRGDEAAFFSRHEESLASRRAVTVGHFGGIERFCSDSFAVLERRPSGADLPDSACEYVIPGAELVILTGTTLVNKTMPRLLQLAAGARVVLVGPTSTLAPQVWGSRVHEVAGAIVTDPEALVRYTALGQARLAHKHALEMFAAILRPETRPAIRSGTRPAEDIKEH